MYFFKCCSKFWVYSNLFEQTYSKNSNSLLKNPVISKRTVTKHFVPTIHFIIIIIITTTTTRRRRRQKRRRSTRKRGVRRRKGNRFMKNLSTHSKDLWNFFKSHNIDAKAKVNHININFFYVISKKVETFANLFDSKLGEKQLLVCCFLWFCCFKRFIVLKLVNVFE